MRCCWGSTLAIWAACICWACCSLIELMKTCCCSGPSPSMWSWPGSHEVKITCNLYIYCTNLYIYCLANTFVKTSFIEDLTTLFGMIKCRDVNQGSNNNDNNGKRYRRDSSHITFLYQNTVEISPVIPHNPHLSVLTL